MIMRTSLLVFLILSLTHCSRPHETHEPHVTPFPITSGTKIRTTEAFTRVVVKGNIDVTLYTGEAKPQVILHGDPRSLSEVQTVVHNGLLYVNVGKGSPHFGRLRAEIRTHYLTSFDYHGSGQITANQLQSGQLDLAINNTGKTAITGKITLQKLRLSGSGQTQIAGITGHQCKIKITGKQRVRLAGTLDLTSLSMGGDSWISLYWIKSKVLKIRAKDKTFIQMAGIADTLDVVLEDKARFNGRYLRGMNVFVKTFGQSVADICAIKTQHTLASGTSNIYFHQYPEMTADFMAWNGSVLDMREWDIPDLNNHQSIR